MIIPFNEFRLKFSEALEEESIRDLEPNVNFKNLDFWDSFSVMLIIAMIDSEFSITIKSEEMASINTLQELYDFIITQRR